MKSQSAFLSWEAKKFKIQDIGREIGELHNTPHAMAELREIVKESYSDYYHRNVGKVAKFISKRPTTKDPFGKLDRQDVTRQFFILPWEAVSDALDLLEEQGYGGMTAQEKQKKIQSLFEQKEKLTAEAAELMPEEVYFRRHYQHGGLVNTAEVLFDHWRDLSRWTADACDPKGVALRFAAEDIQRAHAVLNLSQLRISKAHLLPMSERRR